MNKQILIAGLLGAANAAAAPTPCDNAFVAYATEVEAEAIANAKEAKDATAGLQAALTSATDAKTPVTLVLTTRTSAKAALETAYNAANTAWSTRDAARTAAQNLAAAELAKIAPLDLAVTASELAVTNKNKDIADLQDLYDELVKAIVDDEATIAGLELLSQAAITNETTGKAALETAQLAFNAATELRARITGTTSATYNLDGTVLVMAATPGTAAATADGDTKLLATAAALVTSTNTAYTDKLAHADYTGAASALNTAQQASEKAAAILAAVTAGCTAACAGNAPVTGDPVLAQKVAAALVTTQQDAGTSLTLAATTTGKIGLYETQTAALGGLSDTWQTAVMDHKAIEVRDGLVGATLISGGALFDARTNADSAITTPTTGLTALKTAAASAVTNSAAQTGLVANTLKRDNMLIELNREKALLAPLVADVAVKTYLAQIPKDAQAAADADVLTKTAGEITAFLNLKNAAKVSLDAAEAAVTYAKANDDVEVGRVAAAQAAFNANAGAIVAADLAVVARGAEKVQIIADCKGAGYTRAQQALVAMNSQQTADQTKATQVASDYALRSAFGSGGGANTPCAQVADADGNITRAECSEGFCCGAAQKVERNGDKLAVETCQTNTGVRSYTYYPPLVAGAIVEPTPETWRFQCISGATQLAAAATAALVAATML